MVILIEKETFFIDIVRYNCPLPPESPRLSNERISNMICGILHNLGKIWGSYCKGETSTKKTAELYNQEKKKPYQKWSIKATFHSSSHCKRLKTEDTSERMNYPKLVRETLCVQRIFVVYLKHLVLICLHFKFPRFHYNCSKSWNFYSNFHQQISNVWKHNFK